MSVFVSNKQHTHNSNDSNEHDERYYTIRCVRMRVDIRVSRLIDFYHTQPANHIHERSI